MIVVIVVMCDCCDVHTCSQRIGTALELYERMRSHDLRPSYEAMNHLMVELLRWGDVHGAENMRR